MITHRQQCTRKCEKANEKTQNFVITLLFFSTLLYEVTILAFIDQHRATQGCEHITVTLKMCH